MVSMGSVLGPIFSNFYISDLENKIFNGIRKPPIYLRYIVNDINEINILQDPFQKNSVLNFTHEPIKMSFLDGLIDINNNNSTTSTYKNPLITTPVPSTLIVNTPSDIKKQLLIT